MSVFGPEPGRVAPHIYHEEEIVELLSAARQLRPQGSLRPATFETLFGLMASTGLRVSEAIHLRDADVDLKRGMLIIRRTSLPSPTQLPVHASTVKALARYRRLHGLGTFPRRPTCRFLISSRGNDWGRHSESGRPPRLQRLTRQPGLGESRRSCSTTAA